MASTTYKGKKKLRPRLSWKDEVDREAKTSSLRSRWMISKGNEIKRKSFQEVRT